jgi:coenzyme F420-reducing hydrogenase alpha subunit
LKCHALGRRADVARLAQPEAAMALSAGAVSLSDGRGRGWCEMARGVLMHLVQLGSDDRVRDCRLLAPTPWNFHPAGGASAAAFSARCGSANTAVTSSAEPPRA